jgi:hypothetical protein
MVPNEWMILQAGRRMSRLAGGEFRRILTNFKFTPHYLALEPRK